MKMVRYGNSSDKFIKKVIGIEKGYWLVDWRDSPVRTGVYESLDMSFLLEI
jgi:hypothetical protein